jgi:CubicO group peptidase (beta-lactamase class C family)
MKTNIIDMNRRKVRLWTIGGAGLLITGLLVGALGMFGVLPRQGGSLYEDPQGRFTMEVDPSWEQVETDKPYAQFRIIEPPMNLYLLVLESATVQDAFSQASEITGFDQGLLSGGATATLGDWQAYTQEDSAGLTYGLAGQVVGENAYVAVLKADRPGVSATNAAVARTLASMKIAGKEEIIIESYADLEALVQKEVDRLAGSVSIAMLHQGEVVYTYVYGDANPVEGIAADTQTIYPLGSITKVFTASALMQLVEQGLVELDAWPGEYIPEFPEGWNVTVRQLLTHSACMPDSERLTDSLIARPRGSFAPLEEIFTAYVKENPDLVCEPGKVAQYSNPGFLALGRIIEAVSGVPYESYIVDHILAPLAMESSQFELVEADERYAKIQFPASQTEDLIARLNALRGPGQEDFILHRGESFSTLDDYRILPPWGGLRGTPSDLTHFLQMHMNDGRYGDAEILQPETVAAMQKMQTSKDGSPLGFGLSWWIEQDDSGDYYSHDGSGAGFEAKMRFYPDLNLGVVVAASVGSYQSDRIAEGLVDAWMHEQ